jgi:hypothetical protein
MPYSIHLTHRSYPNTVSSGDGEGGDKDKDKDGQKDKEKDREKEPKRHTDPFERNGGKSIPLQLKALNECLLGKWPRPCTPLVTLPSLHSSPCTPLVTLLSSKMHRRLTSWTTTSFLSYYLILIFLISSYLVLRYIMLCCVVLCCVVDIEQHVLHLRSFTTLRVCASFLHSPLPLSSLAAAVSSLPLCASSSLTPYSLLPLPHAASSSYPLFPFLLSPLRCVQQRVPVLREGGPAHGSPQLVCESRGSLPARSVAE